MLLTVWTSLLNGGGKLPKELLRGGRIIFTNGLVNAYTETNDKKKLSGRYFAFRICVK